MTVKTRIVELLGEKGLVLPALLDAALIANDRAKYVLALLQMAVAHAEDPSGDVATLAGDREACGIPDRDLDRTVAECESDGRGHYHIPGAQRLIEILAAALRAMLAPVELAAESPEAGAPLAARFAALVNGLPVPVDDMVSGAAVAALTSGRPVAGDGIHLLIMDLHKDLNRVQAAIADEDVGGAKAYGIDEADRPLIAAFMAGVRRTAPLKFDHPGLGTTAARSGGTLLIQNDIGTTEAHVLVIRITGTAVSLTYTDVHAPRLRFLENTLAGTGIAWEELRTRQAPGMGDNDLFYMTTGRFSGPDAATVAGFLDRLGSRLVFLIDWNRARKRLGLLVPNDVAVDLLTWAAERDLGHRGFLQLGGERLIYDALEQAVRTPLRYGEPLHEMIGAEVARDFLRFVLEATAAGLQAHRSEALIRDQIRAELFNHFRSAAQRLLADGGRHAAIIGQLAAGLRRSLHQGVGHQAAGGGSLLARNAAEAKDLETKADEIVKATRSTSRRIVGTEIFCRIIEVADDAADHLEDAAFLVGLLSTATAPTMLPAPLLKLSDLLVDGAQAFRRALDIAQTVHRGGAREPIQQFLEAADRLVQVEHATDEREREVTVALIADTVDSRQLFLLSGIAREFEEAADALLRASLILRDHILGEVMFA